MKTKEDQYTVVVEALSWFVWHYSCIAAAEQHNPAHPADEMDHLIADSKQRAAAIRKIRDDFEHIVSGLLR